MSTSDVTKTPTNKTEVNLESATQQKTIEISGKKIFLFDKKAKHKEFAISLIN